MSAEIKLKYNWRRLPNDPETLFHGDDGDRRMGRVQKAVTGEYWLWFMNFQHGINDPKVAVTLNGGAETGRQAAAACERCYEAVLDATWPGMTPALRDRLLAHEKEMKDRKEQWAREDAMRRRQSLRVVS
ncbi:hypothetical protein FA04_13720 [Ensifer adhaerens]|uniref:Uncharacterized protein n=1 Tax=Ensifer adhaerens TaxID=106592 RepID=A0ABY8HC34_ENSAD|nr:hypothetical protein [Ensifer adhaerens]ANK73582.1 hypothetical protein FA04_13720 [Ensifer adhaerens]KDP73607.1 hypothetical protein FA04_10905 [Ensifer adhaerens]WFP89656.1 hypothetical protein P4B07_13935 [Ensifer adhaerens]